MSHCFSLLPDCLAHTGKDVADLLLVELRGVPLDGYGPLAGARIEDPGLELQGRYEWVYVLDGPERVDESELFGEGLRGRRGLDTGGLDDDRGGKVGHLLATHLGGSGVDRGEDLGVLAATADVSRKPFRDLHGRWLRVHREQRDRRHDEAARADAALESTIEPERTLDRMKSGDAGTGREARDGLDLLTAAEPRRENGAAVHGLAVDEHRARAALRAVAPEIRVRKTELEVHRLPEALAVVDNDVVCDPIDLELDATHRRGQRTEIRGGGAPARG